VLDAAGESEFRGVVESPLSERFDLLEEKKSDAALLDLGRKVT